MKLQNRSKNHCTAGGPVNTGLQRDLQFLAGMSPGPQYGNFAHRYGIDEGFVASALIEIAWNSIIHSRSEPGKGYTLLYGEVDTRIKEKPIFKFRALDMGLGICNTLGDVYVNKRPDTTKETLYENRTNKILKFSIDDEGTRRNVHPSEGYAKSFRGLKTISYELRGRGHFKIFSGDGAIKVQANDKRQLTVATEEIDSPFPASFPGVLISGEFFGGYKNGTQNKHHKSGINIDINNIACYRLINTLKDPIPPRDDAFIIDAEFERDSKIISDLYINLASHKKPVTALIINHKIPYNQTPSIIKAAHATHAPGVYIYLQFDKGEIVTIASDILEVNAYNIKPLSLEERLEVAFKANQLHINGAYSNSGVNEAVYVGKIHTLSGDITDYYYSYAKEKKANGSKTTLRWMSNIKLGVDYFLSEHDIDEKFNNTLVLIGFCGPVSELAINIAKQTSPQLSAIGILAFEIPDRNSIIEKIGSYKNAILITDVISSGSLLNEVIGVILKCGLNILGAITLVDKNPRNNRAISRTYDAEPNITLIRCSHIARPKQVPSPTIEYWIDPLTHQLDVTQPLEDISSFEILRSLDILAKTSSINIGRIQDGDRVSSIYVDVSNLIVELEDNNSWQSIIIPSINDRIRELGWDEDFLPQVIIIPSAVDRYLWYAPSDERSGVKKSYITAAKGVGHLLRLHFGVEKEVFEVPRIMDTSGRAVIAPDKLSLNTEFFKFDAIIADDGMCSGETISSLARLLGKEGAKRILAVPLLTRMELRNIAPYREVISITNKNKDNTLLAYALPLIYPVPFYRIGNDPFGKTKEKLSKYTNNGYPINKIAEELVKQHNYIDRNYIPNEKYSQEYRKCFLIIRAYCSLAIDSRIFAEKLVDLINEINSYDSFIACITLFLNEWSLLNQSGLRQRVLIPIKNMIVRSLTINAATSDLTKDALSLTRTVIPSEYGNVFKSVNNSFLEDPRLYLRIVFHLATMSTSYLNNDTIKSCIRDLIDSDLIEIVLNNSSYSRTLRDMTFRSVVVLQGLLKIDKTSDYAVESIAKSITNIENFYKSGNRTHNLSNLVNSLIKNTEGSRSILDQDDEYWQHFEFSWDDALKYLEKLVFPSLETLRPLISSVWTRGEIDVLPKEISYFLDKISTHTDKKDTNFYSDAYHISQIIQLHLKTNNSEHDFSKNKSKSFSQTISRSVGLIAKRMNSNVIADGNNLRYLVSDLAPSPLEAILNTLTKRFSCDLAINEKNINVTYEADALKDPRLNAIMPSFLKERLAVMIANNLQKYAFPNGVDNLKKIEICVSYIESNTNKVSIVIKNNGEPVRQTKFRKNSHEIKRLMKLFGGELHEIKPSSDPEWVCIFEFQIEVLKRGTKKLTDNR